MVMKWYGAKTLYRARAYGGAIATDRYHDPQASLVEERVVLFRARSFDDAIEKAEKEAATYVKDTHVNPYGQTVRVRYLGDVNVYELFDAPGAGVEVYSRTEFVPARESDATVRARLLRRESKTQSKRRINILNSEFSGLVRKRRT
jgi:hypothetical protein